MPNLTATIAAILDYIKFITGIYAILWFLVTLILMQHAPLLAESIQSDLLAIVSQNHLYAFLLYVTPLVIGLGQVCGMLPSVRSKVSYLQGESRLQEN